ncbi:MAG TPA: hypothetical protein PLW93_05265 [Candidatus Absconditabacterales bacterium]|nr:hypothetical protein [Candidatus Absconditabacterales bacterium]
MELIIYSEVGYDKIDHPNGERIISINDHEQRKDSIYIKNNGKGNAKQLIMIRKDKVPDLIEGLKKLIEC